MQDIVKMDKNTFLIFFAPLNTSFKFEFNDKRLANKKFWQNFIFEVVKAKLELLLKFLY